MASSHSWELGTIKGVLPVLPEEIDDFETETVRFREGKWSDNEFAAFRLRQGVYGQRQPDAQMFRVKIPYGRLTAEQLEALGKVARDFAPLGKGHITTRENIQFHFIPLADTPQVMRLIGEAGLTTREACGNTVRNVTGCPLAGVCRDEVFDISPYAAAFARYFLRHPLTQNMPRKFKVAFSGCATDCAITGIHDLGFLARVREENGEAVRGFRVVSGGGLSILPRVGYTLYDFVPVSDFLRVSEAVIRIFDRSDELRKNRMKARIKFLIDRIGIDAFRERVDAELEEPWARTPIDPAPHLFAEDESADAPPPPPHTAQPNGDNRPFHEWKSGNVMPPRQEGFFAVFVKVPLGDVRAEQFFALAEIAGAYAGGRARTTVQQNLVLRWVRGESLYEVWKKLAEAGLAKGFSTTLWAMP
ncbi:MAG: nitrite/sulfite reductase, partial [Nitrospinota bacterium]